MIRRENISNGNNRIRNSGSGSCGFSVYLKGGKENEQEKHYKSILELTDKINKQDNKKAFIFSTSAVPLEIMHKTLKEKLIEKGFDIIGHFYCKGFMDYGFTKRLFGGLNKRRPNETDLKKVQEFAIKIKER